MSLINLLSIGPGTFVYHLLIFLVLEALVGIAFIKHRHTRAPDDRRLLRTFGGLMGLRVLLLLGEPLGPAAIAPALNGIELASLTLLGWAFLRPSLSQRAGNGYLISGLGATFLCTVTFLPGWYRALAQFPHLLYLTFWQQTFWYAVGALLALAPALLLLRFRRRERHTLPSIAFGTLALGFTTLCVGSLFLTVGWLYVSESTLIGIGRLINMLGYPLFTSVVYQAAHDEQVHRQQEWSASDEMPPPTPVLKFLSEVRHLGSGSLDLDSFLDRVVEGTATALGADLCAIFVVNADPPGTIKATARYPLSERAQRQVAQSAFPLAEQPALAYALKRRKQLILNAETNNPRVRTLYELLGSQETGPTVIQPIVDQRHVLGALVVGNNHSQRAFEPHAIHMCQSIARQVAAALSG
jgi:hypothetical protein